MVREGSISLLLNLPFQNQGHKDPYETRAGLTKLSFIQTAKEVSYNNTSILNQFFLAVIPLFFSDVMNYPDQPSICPHRLTFTTISLSHMFSTASHTCKRAKTHSTLGTWMELADYLCSIWENNLSSWTISTLFKTKSVPSSKLHCIFTFH